MAFTVQIENFAFNEKLDPIDEDGNVPKGQPNPTRITWSKEHSIKTHEIPWPEHKTCRTSKKTLWKCEIDFKIVTAERMQQFQKLVDNCGPYNVKTAFKSMAMYIESFSATSEESYNDYYFSCSVKLKERND